MIKTVKVLDRNENLRASIEIFSYIYKWVSNGEHSLTFTTLEEITNEERIIYRDNIGEYREFIIKDIENEHLEDGTIAYLAYCEDSFYETDGDYIEDKRFRNEGVTRAIMTALEPTRWEPGIIEDLGTATTSFYRESVKEAIQGKLIPAWQGELFTRVKIVNNRITNRYVDIKKTLGDFKGKRFDYDKDVTTIKRTIDTTDLCTALYGYGKGEEIEGSDAYGRRINFADVNEGKAYVENLEALNMYGRNGKNGKAHIFGKVEFDDCTDKKELLELTRKELEHRSRPRVTYELEVEDLGVDFEKVDRGETVIVKDKDLGLTITSRVIEYEEYEEDGAERTRVKLGDHRELLTDTIDRVDSFVTDFRSKSGVWDRAEELKPDGLTSSYIKDVLARVNEEMDYTKSRTKITEGDGIISTSIDGSKAIQILGGGFRIANKKNADGTWKWTTAGDGDGLVADAMTTGILTANLIRAGVLADLLGNFTIDMENGNINIGDKLIYNSKSGELTILGYADDADLQGAKTEFKQTSESILQRVQGAEDTIADLEIKDGQIIASVKDKVGKTDYTPSVIIGKINEGRGVQISGDKVNLQGRHITLDGDTEVMGTFKVGDANIRNLSAETITTGTLKVNSSGTHTGTLNNKSATLGGTYYNAEVSGSSTGFNANSNAFTFNYGTNSFEVQGRIGANPKGNRHAIELNGLTLHGDSGSFKSTSSGYELRSNGELNLRGYTVKINGKEIYDNGDGGWASR